MRCFVLCWLVLCGFLIKPVPALALGAGQTPLRSNLSPYGKACLTTKGESRPAFSQPRVSEHWVMFANACSKRITGKVCYFETLRCAPFAISGYGNQNIYLGSAVLQSYFKFRVEEKVDTDLMR
jgi:hypothetical protein